MDNKREQKLKLINLAIEEYLDTPEELRSLTKLGEKYGVKRQTLSKHLKDRGYEVINYQNRVRLNETLFDKIDTEEKAYWLGFMYADGNISHTGNRIEVRLAIKDLDHLEKFRKFLNLTTEIRTGICNGNGFCHLAVRNKHMWNALDKLGCHPQKSLILTFPSLSIFSNTNLIRHFIRGYVDGDGGLYTGRKLGKTCINTTLNMVGTKAFLEKVNKMFHNKGYIRNKTCKNWENKAYSLTFSDLISRKIARILYQDATIYMDRKYNKYLEFCRLEEESSRRKSSKIGEFCNDNTETSIENKGSEEVVTHRE